MAYRLIISQSAEEDLAAIVGYIVNELCNPDAAIKLLDGIDKCYDALEENPYIYARCTQPLLRAGDYRKTVIGRYLLIFRIDEDKRIVYVERYFNELEDYANRI